MSIKTDISEIASRAAVNKSKFTCIFLCFLAAALVVLCVACAKFFGADAQGAADASDAYELDADTASALEVAAPEISPPANYNGWFSAPDGTRYWRECGVVAVSKAFYDTSTNAWYWADADGTIATNKDVFIPVSNENGAGGKWVRFDENSRMVKGEDCRNGDWYYFDETTGEMARGFKSFATGGSKTVFYDYSTGVMQKGETAIDGEWYLLDNVTGAVTYGFHWLNNGKKWVYLDRASGKMAHGTCSIGGKDYTFNTYTGALENASDLNLLFNRQGALSSKLTSGQVKSVRVFGDSVLAGIGASDYAGLTWNWLFSLDGTNFYEPNMTGSSAGARLRSNIASHGASFVGACIPFQGSMALFSQLQNKDYGSENFAVVMLGTNDRGTYQDGESLNDYVNYANNFLSRLTSIYGQNVIVLSSAPVLDESDNFTLASANASLKQLCESNNWAFASTYETFEALRNLEGFSKESCYADEAHLNDFGQEILWATLQYLLEL